MATTLTLAMLNDDEQQLLTQKLAQRRWISKSTQTMRLFNSRENTGSRIFLDPTRMQGNVSGFIYDSALMQAAILPLRSEISPLP
ncbi:hypothetical protein G5I_14429 [Acromyrmex echinatior]|uniref:Uncharacterized protein n=1 Tax=Acromyrmex echinatior TaxID=103372 RepID=F4X7P5_ACREC|nr:hypothetical protein G5I_14429 [Acromyrmex echinatior]